MITEKSAHFIVETTTGNIPKEAVDITKIAIMDLIGVALAVSGSREEEIGGIITETVKVMGGEKVSTVLGKGFKSSPYFAALANGTMGHAIDYDDVSFYWYNGHPSSCLVPTALAIGESVGASGMDIIAAYIVGFEVAASINSLLNESHRKQGWHATGTTGILGAASVAARLLKLNVQQTQMAIGIAASLAGGLGKNTGTMTKPLHAGHAASNGILASLLAQKGFTADENIIEGPRGYARVFGCLDEIDWDKASEHLGKKFVITAPAIEFKRYPSCGATTGFIDVALDLKRTHNIDPNMIAEIVLNDTTGSRNPAFDFPKTGHEAEFSKHYCACRALYSGKVGIEHFTSDTVKQPEVVELIKRTKYIPNFYPDSIGTFSIGREGKLSPQSVSVKLKDGTEYFGETKAYKYTRGVPMTTEELEQKYQDCASMALKKNSVTKSFALLKNLESLGNIRELMNIVKG